MTLLLWLWTASVAAQMALFILAFCRGLPRFHALPKPLPQGDPQEATDVAVIVPMAGENPDMEAALTSLIEQDYPLLRVYLSTYSEADPAVSRETLIDEQPGNPRDPAWSLARTLAARYPHVRHVEAGRAQCCGQKNKNLLDALAQVAKDTKIYVFCDANHLARPDFVRELVRPLLQGQAFFCTGYRKTRLCHGGLFSVVCHMLNRLMLLLESLPVFTQPWGGAMAADAAVFHELDVPGLWSRTVVDDCSLAGLLKARGIPVLYRPTALLETPVRAMNKAKLEAWYFRQLAYPKFYTFGPWLLIGLVPLWVAVTLAASLDIACRGMFWEMLTLSPASSAPLFAWSPSAAFAYLGTILTLQELLRRRIAASCSRRVWLGALPYALWLTLVTYARTVFTDELVWHGLRYQLARDGQVEKVTRVSRS